ncbi:MAG TPA: DUF4350 domain-containing protein [Chitinophagaceae bacterium]|nr:DUF4350 domain-containing protein [Chitinophagaceae bacterium]
MKRFAPYILGVLLGVAIIILLFTMNSRKKMNEKITLRKPDKIPYGTYVAYRNLPYLFPDAAIYPNLSAPGYWDSVYIAGKNQAFICITAYFGADEEEMKELISFVENGNDVFVSAMGISDKADEMLRCGTSSYLNLGFDFISSALPDTLSVALKKPYFHSEDYFSYPGKRMAAWFHRIDSITTDVLGKDDRGRPNFIRLRAGKGHFYLQLAPLAFSNFFLLHKNNIQYYEQALSMMNAKADRIIWDEYYLRKRFSESRPSQGKKWLTKFLSYPSFLAAFLTALFTIIMYVLLEMRRKQKYIPVVAKPRNDSLDFVKTIGRLYFDKGDHKNLARKMGAYFLEHVRNRYKLATGELNDNFVKNLGFKSGIEEPAIKSIVTFIRYADDASSVTAAELSDFHRQLESFYKTA